MYLVHKTSGEKVLLAKYYPTSKWYMFYQTFHRYNEFFLKHQKHQRREILIII